MKTKILFVLLICTGLVTTKSYAQDEIDLGLRVGGGLSFITADYAGVGFNIRSDAHFSESFGASLDVTLFSTEELYELSTVNINGFYDINPGSVSPYLLGGINIAVISVFGFSSTDIGFNLGGGVDVPLGDKILFFGEGKYVVSSLDDLVITAGIKYRL